MKLFAILIYDLGQKMVASQYNLADFPFIYQSFIKQTIEKIATDSLSHLLLGNTYQVTEKYNDLELVIYANSLDKYSIIITDKEYPKYTAYELLLTLKNSTISDLGMALENIFNKYKNVTETDKLTSVSQEIDETKIIIFSALEKLIQRGEQLVQLTEKIDEFNKEAVDFNIAAQQNNCCNIIG